MIAAWQRCFDARLLIFLTWASQHSHLMQPLPPSQWLAGDITFINTISTLNFKSVSPPTQQPLPPPPIQQQLQQLPPPPQPLPPFVPPPNHLAPIPLHPPIATSYPTSKMSIHLMTEAFRNLMPRYTPTGQAAWMQRHGNVLPGFDWAQAWRLTSKSSPLTSKPLRHHLWLVLHRIHVSKEWANNSGHLYAACMHCNMSQIARQHDYDNTPHHILWACPGAKKFWDRLHSIASHINPTYTGQLTLASVLSLGTAHNVTDMEKASSIIHLFAIGIQTINTQPRLSPSSTGITNTDIRESATNEHYHLLFQHFQHLLEDYLSSMLFSFAKSIKPFVQGDPKAQLQGRADGASRGNPGHAGAGWTIYSMPTGAVLSDHHKYIGNTTNNVAEYKAMCSLLLELRDKCIANRLFPVLPPLNRVHVRADSKLIIQQLFNNWRITEQHLFPIFQQCQQYITEIRNIGIAVTASWVPRRFNQRADALANHAVDQHLAGYNFPPSPLPQPSILHEEALYHQELEAAIDRLACQWHGLITLYFTAKQDFINYMTSPLAAQSSFDPSVLFRITLPGV